MYQPSNVSGNNSNNLTERSHEEAFLLKEQSELSTILELGQSGTPAINNGMASKNILVLFDKVKSNEIKKTDVISEDLESDKKIINEIECWLPVFKENMTWPIKKLWYFCKNRLKFEPIVDMGESEDPDNPYKVTLIMLEEVVGVGEAKYYPKAKTQAFTMALQNLHEDNRDLFYRLMEKQAKQLQISVASVRIAREEYKNPTVHDNLICKPVI